MRQGEIMSDEADVFTAVDFIGGDGPPQTFVLFGGSILLNDKFWDVEIVPRGTNTGVQLLSKQLFADAAGKRTLQFTVQNLTGNDTFFTRVAVRIPND
jgi:hypothetical protein